MYTIIMTVGTSLRSPPLHIQQHTTEQRQENLDEILQAVQAGSPVEILRDGRAIAKSSTLMQLDGRIVVKPWLTRASLKAKATLIVVL